MFNLNESQIEKIITKLVEKIISDKNVKALVKEKTTQFIDVAKKNNDLESFGMEQKSIDNFYKNFDSEWDENMKNVKVNDINWSSLRDTNPNLNVSFRFDSDNIIRNIQIKEELNIGKSSITIKGDIFVRAINDSIVIKKPSLNSAVDLGNMNSAIIDSIENQISSRIEKIIKKNIGIK